MQFLHNWHIEALAQHVENMIHTEHYKGVYNIPPGCMKSLIFCVFLPAYVWGPCDWPGARFFHASYSEDLSFRDSRACRALVESEWYQSRWPNVQIRTDANQVRKFDTTRGGWRMAATVKGRGTGEHPDFIIADDPHNVKQAESDAEREQAIRWWSRTMGSRGVIRGARRAIVMQRLHEKDLSQHALGSGKYEHICLPMRYEAGRMSATTLGWQDPRTTSGELLWPGAFPESSVAELERELGPYGAAGQLQQRPAPLGGGKFRDEWFELVDAAEAPSAFDSMVRGWDLAYTEGAGDYTASVLIALRGEQVWVLDGCYGQWGAGHRDDNMELAAMDDDAKYPGRVMIRFPEDPAAGKQVAQILQSRLTAMGYRSKYETAGGRSKDERCTAFASRAWGDWKAGRRVKVVKGPWVYEWLSQLTQFPNAAHDDFVDATSEAWNALAIKRPFVVRAL